jgi:hypothetical protein
LNHAPLNDDRNLSRSSPNPGPLPKIMCEKMATQRSLSKCHSGLAPLFLWTSGGGFEPEISIGGFDERRSREERLLRRRARRGERVARIIPPSRQIKNQYLETGLVCRIPRRISNPKSRSCPSLRKRENGVLKVNAEAAKSVSIRRDRLLDKQIPNDWNGCIRDISRDYGNGSKVLRSDLSG